jgi:arylsulfatase A-like enzyme
VSDRPDILLIVLDTARADHFGPYGGRSSTPAFDDLAGRGTTVANALSASCWTAPSHASMFSGLAPFAHGVTGGTARTAKGGLGTFRPAIRRLEDRWLPSVLGRGGYRTAGISANVWVTPSMGFGLGFEDFTAVGGARAGDPRAGAAATPTAARTWARKRVKRVVRAVRDYPRGRDDGAIDAYRTLKRHWADGDDRPSFTFVNIMEAHAPYMPPAAYNPLHGARRLTAGIVDRYAGNRFQLAYNLGVAEIPPGHLDTLRQLYSGEVAYADRFVEMALDALGPRLERTLVIVTADHGEHLGEDHLLGHQLSLGRNLVHVPLALSGPGIPGWVEGPVFSTAWLPALIAEAAGLPDAPWRAPAERVAVAQYESGRKQLAHAEQVVETLGGEARFAGRLDRTLELASDGTSTLLDDAGVERIEGDAGKAGVLRAALEAARTGSAAEPPAEEGLSPGEEASIEAHLEELGYL